MIRIKQITSGFFTINGNPVVVSNSGIDLNPVIIFRDATPDKHREVFKRFFFNIKK